MVLSGRMPKEESQSESNPDVTLRDNVGMQRFNCRSKLIVTYVQGPPPGTRVVLYHFDQVFTILENSVSEKAEKLSFELRRILKQSVF